MRMRFLLAESYLLPNEAFAGISYPLVRFVVWLDDTKTKIVADEEPGQTLTGSHVEPDRDWVREIVVTTAEALTTDQALERAKALAIREWLLLQPRRNLGVPPPFDPETGDDLGAENGLSASAAGRGDGGERTGGGQPGADRGQRVGPPELLSRERLGAGANGTAAPAGRDQGAGDPGFPDDAGVVVEGADGP